MTGTELIDSVKGHLGDRASGYIGSEAVDLSVMNSVNKGLIRLCKGYDPAEMKKQITIDVTTANYRYAYPVVDTSAVTIRIKSFHVCRILASGEETGHPLAILEQNQKDSMFPIMDSDRTGRPILLSTVGEYIELYPWPDQNYTIYAHVNVWPTLFTASTTGNSSPYGIEWDEVIEAFATHDCFAKLQQTTDSVNWLSIFKASFKNTVATIRKRMPIIQDATLRDLCHPISPDYARDPFVRSMP